MKGGTRPRPTAIPVHQCVCDCGATVYATTAALKENEGGCPECDEDSTLVKIGTCECCPCGIYATADLAGAIDRLKQQGRGRLFGVRGADAWEIRVG